MRNLVLIRHGKAAPKLWDEATTQDHARKLEPQGVHQSSASGAWLRAQGITPHHILCSTAARAIETCKAVLDGMGISSAATTFHDDIYYRDVADILNVVHNAPADAQTVFVVGHNPTIPETAMYLDNGQTPAIGNQFNYGFALAGVAWLTCDGMWADLARNGARLKAYYDPSQDAIAGNTSASAR